MQAREREVEYYDGPAGCPFADWRRGITDNKLKQAVDARITRLRAGNPGVSRSVHGGVLESVISMGPGYRIYYGIDGDTIVLLCAGDKSTQATDIEMAKRLWAEYKGRK